MEIIREYELEERLKYFISDNAKSCDTIINVILDTLLPALSPASRSQRRLRCYGHILNLAVRAFL